MEVQPRKRPNWKIMFLSLAGMNALLLSLLLFLLLWPATHTELPEQQWVEEISGTEFTVHSNKQKLNELVNEYVDKLLKDNGNKYKVDFNENVHLMGSIEAFHTDIPISITLEPSVQENADLILNPTEISLGLLPLPKKKILQFVKQELITPEWVEIDTKNQNIYIGVTQMKVKNNFKVKIQQFDLKNDNISFLLNVPNKTLGL